MGLFASAGIDHAGIAIATLLVAACLAGAIGRGRAAVIIGLVASLAASALMGVGAFAEGALATGRTVYLVGFLVSAGVWVSLVAGAVFFDDEFGASASGYGVALTLIIGAGWSAALASGDGAVMFGAVAAAWLAAVGLVGLSAHVSRGALTGALRMLAAGAAGVALIGFGLAFIDPYLGDALVQSQAGAGRARLAIGAVLVVLGLGFVAPFAPFHGWIGAVYGRIGPGAICVLACVSMTGAAGVAMRIVDVADQAGALMSVLRWGLIAAGAGGVVLACVQAIAAAHVGRLIGYAGVACSGIVLVALGLGGAQGYETALLCLAAQAGALILVIVGFGAHGSLSWIARTNGLARRAPVYSAGATIGLLSLMGAPLTLGFVTRWRMIEASSRADAYVAAVAAIAMSLGALAFGIRLIERMYVRRSEDAVSQRSAAGARVTWLAPALIAALGLVLMGLNPTFILHAAQGASDLATGAGR